MSKHKQAKDPVPVERKVIAAVSGSSVVGVLLAIAVGIQGGVIDVTWLPTWAQSLIGFVVAVVLVGYPAYRTSHTTRPDIPKKASSATGGTANVKIIADTSQFTAALDEAKTHVESLTAAVSQAQVTGSAEVTSAVDVGPH